MKKIFTHHLKPIATAKLNLRPVLFRYVLFIGLVSGFAQAAAAQQTQPVDKETQPVVKALSDPKLFLVSFTAGTTGLGLEAKKVLNRRFSVKGGFSFLPQLSFTNNNATTPFNNNSKYSGNFSKAQLLLEYSPFKIPGIRLVGGGAYLFALKTTIDRRATSNYTNGNIVFTPEDIGVMHLLANWKGPAAYAGLSFFKIVPHRVFNLTLDLGTYYLSSPQTSISGTQLLAVNDNDNNRQHWQENVNQYRWLPALQVNFSFKIDKLNTK